MIQINEGDSADPFAALAEVCRPWTKCVEADVPFYGGWIGYIAYEAGRFLEPSASWTQERTGLPLAWWGFYDAVLIVDHLRDEWRVAGLVTDDSDDVESRVRLWEDGIAESDHCGAAIEGHGIAEGVWNDSTGHYQAKIQGVIDYIRAGDVFQVNLARRYRARCDVSAVQLYQRLCDANPACYSAFLQGDSVHDWAVLSSSPELFLSVDDGVVLTRPIKGTAPRGAAPSEDVANRRILATSPKDRAELSMIIDLLRNDLGRVCDFGSVRVLCDGEIEELPTVFHRTATISGRLRDDCDAIDLLRATFPGGSITGAPKVRAMQIIAGMEGFGRGPYCGAIGYLGVDGAMQLNIPIRTMTLLGDRLDLFVGSGIVADSDPAMEYEELNAKAAGMMAALHDSSSRRSAVADLKAHASSLVPHGATVR